MSKSAPRPASKKSAGASTLGGKAYKVQDKIHITQASADEIRTTLGITPAEMRVAAKAVAAANKSAPSGDRVTVSQKAKAARASAAKRAHAR